MIGIILLAALVPVMFYCMYQSARRERKDWNGGICPHCGTPLVHFDTDSQGGHLWECPGCDYTTAVSYHRTVYGYRQDKYK